MGKIIAKGSIHMYIIRTLGMKVIWSKIFDISD